MKKKLEKKLVLAKETVRRLEDGQPGAVVGGTTFYPSCIWNCPWRTIACHNPN